MYLDGLVSKIAAAVLEKIETTPFVKIGVSNRHLHVSREDLDALFGKGYSLTPVKELLPGQYACGETVTVTGKKSSVQKVRILGPVRGQTQLEISVTDGFVLGVPAPVNESGNLSGAGSVVIENPLNGARIEKTCAIAALRHIHLTVEYARKYGLRDKQFVEAEFDGCRKAKLGGVLIRVSPDFRDEMHIDTDEANAVFARDGEYARIIP
ncbi:MAG: phosphate propanoyltransferase [Synergistaceae bacterium]|jgi:putative phosphotransacetylase|nr:phosphate propanoyltransferase [Synergistaceae bacterium]